MKRYFIKLAFNGAKYHGWQIQENAHTIQAEINEKLSMLVSEQINVVGCGRTDTGVHAKEFYAHFDTENPIFEPEDLRYKIDKFLPSDIVVTKVYEVPPEMHVRFTARSRTYRYYINQVKDPFKFEMSYYYSGNLDINKMNVAAENLLLYEDFTSFSKLHTQTQTNLCKIKEASWEKFGSNLVFTIKADRFLRNMVRAIVGTLLEIGKGNQEPEDIKTIIEAKDRSRAGYSVPAKGLFLEEVLYHEP